MECKEEKQSDGNSESDSSVSCDGSSRKRSPSPEY